MITEVTGVQSTVAIGPHPLTTAANVVGATIGHVLDPIHRVSNFKLFSQK